MATPLYRPFFLVLLLIVVISVLILSPKAARSGSCTLSWEISDSQDLDHFNVYIGTSSGKYDSHISVGSETSYTFTGLQAGQRYFLAVKAVDAAGKEIVFSDETTCTVYDVESLGGTITPNMLKQMEAKEAIDYEIEQIFLKGKSEGLSDIDKMRLQQLIDKRNFMLELNIIDKSSQNPPVQLIK